MGAMSNGYYYDQVKRGEGYTVTAPRLYFSRVTKASSQNLKRQLLADGFKASEINIEKNEAF